LPPQAVVRTAMAGRVHKKVRIGFREAVILFIDFVLTVMKKDRNFPLKIQL
jgi:hypothetical protein